MGTLTLRAALNSHAGMVKGGAERDELEGGGGSGCGSRPGGNVKSDREGDERNTAGAAIMLGIGGWNRVVITERADDLMGDESLETQKGSG